MNNNKIFLDLNKLQGEKTSVISSKDSFKDITPICWSEKVLLGEKKHDKL